MEKQLVIADARVIDLMGQLGNSWHPSIVLQTIFPGSGCAKFDDLDRVLDTYFTKASTLIERAALVASDFFNVDSNRCRLTLTALSNYLQDKSMVDSRKIQAFIASKNGINEIVLNNNE